MTDKEFYQALTNYKGGIPEPLYETCAVLAYEVGRMLEHAMYMKWDSGDSKGLAIRRGFLKSELMDAVAQIALISVAIGTSLEEMRELGVEKALERFTRKEAK